MARQRYYKAVRPDGGSFHDPSFVWATEPGGITTHPDFRKGNDARGYLSVATVPTDCTGMSWPARLLVVESVPGHPVFAPDKDGLPNKRAAEVWRTIEERPAHELFGPQGEAVAALIARARTVTDEEASGLYAAGHAAWYVARYAARYAAGHAAGHAAWHAARHAARRAAGHAARHAAGDAAGDAAGAVCLRDLVGTGKWTQEAYDLLTAPWATVIGRVHPDDRDRKEA